MTAAIKAASVILAAAVCLLLVGGASRPSYACECIARTQEEYFNDATAVFAGQVVDIDRLDNDNDKDYAITFSVSRYWKGLSENDGFVVARLDSFDGNLCGYPFQEGEEYLTYAFGSGSQLYVGGCYGTSPIADAGDSLSVLGTGAVPRGNVIFVDPDPLDGIAPATAAPYQPDFVLIFIAAAIGFLSAGIAVLIIRKPKR